MFPIRVWGVGNGEDSCARGLESNESQPNDTRVATIAGADELATDLKLDAWKKSKKRRSLSHGGINNYDNASP